MHYKQAKTILSPKNGMNVYRGCTHGCIYCDSRSDCYNMDHDFEDIEVKINAPELLDRRLSSKRKKCMVGTGSMTDPYIHLESELRVARQCFETVERHGFGLTMITKSNRVLDDLDLLKRINKKTKCVVQMTLTTYDDELCKILEPNVSTTSERVEALKILRDNGIPTVVWLTPFLPFINDDEANLRGLLDYCIDADVLGIIFFGIGLTLRDGNREYFYKQLDRNFPGLKEKYRAKYGMSYHIPSDNDAALTKIFHRECADHGIMHNNAAIFEYLNEFPESPSYSQMSFI